ncbi:MAG TPA: hypothetical protein VGB36_07730, partial [Gammaproteobacteria bacterium]
MLVALQFVCALAAAIGLMNTAGMCRREVRFGVGFGRVARSLMVVIRRKSRSATLKAEPENQQQENPAGTPGTPAHTNADPPVGETCARRHTVKQLARKDWNRHVRLQPEWQINQILYQPMPIQPHCKVGHI